MSEDNTSAAAASSSHEVMVIDDDDASPADVADHAGAPIDFEVGKHFTTADDFFDSMLTCTGCNSGEPNLIDPIQFGCATHSMCVECMKCWTHTKILGRYDPDTVSIPCPLCRDEGARLYSTLKAFKPSPNLLHTIRMRQCACPNDGCGEVFAFGQAGATELAHARACEHRVYHCPNSGCSFTSKRGVDGSAVKAHKAECPHEQVACAHCSKSFKRALQHESSCDQRVVQCGECEEQIKVGEMAAHAVVVENRKCAGFVACPNGCQESHKRQRGAAASACEERDQPLALKRGVELSEHLLECPNRMVSCKICRQSYKACEATEHDRNAREVHKQALFKAAEEAAQYAPIISTMQNQLRALEERMQQVRPHDPLEGYHKAFSECVTFDGVNRLSLEHKCQSFSGNGLGPQKTQCVLNTVNVGKALPQEKHGSFAVTLKRMQRKHGRDDVDPMRVNWLVRVSQLKPATAATTHKAYLPADKSEAEKQLAAQFDLDAKAHSGDWIPMQTSFVVGEEQRAYIGNIERFSLDNPLHRVGTTACVLLELYAKVIP